MGFNCGIVGLPNVGKSTLFNALTATQSAEAANYPFCTIEPNVGKVSVPDKRLDALANIAKPLKVIPTQLEFTDIAGLVKGASRGEGLGNKFLANIREVDAIVHVLRCFEDGNITHVDGSVDPIRDIDTIETELMLSDLESLEKRIIPIEKKAKSGEKEAKQTYKVMSEVIEILKDGKLANNYEPENEEDAKTFKNLMLLTSKLVLYVCNVEEDNAAEGNEFSKKVAEYAKENGSKSVVISAAIEAEVAALPKEEQQEFLETLGLSETGLSKIIREGYDLLNLSTYFTAGQKEVRAWTIKKNCTAPQAAGVIHTDFEKGFIRAEVIAYDDYITYEGEAKAREAGKLRSEGKAYLMNDGDVCHFLFNV